MLEERDIIEWMYKKELSKELLWICWVYLLIDYDDEVKYFNIVYAWQSVDIWRRIKEHKFLMIIPFTHIYPIECSCSDLNENEQSLIYTYNPEYNHVFNNRWWYRRYKDIKDFLWERWYIVRDSILNKIIKDSNIQSIEYAWIKYYNCYQILKLLK